MSFYLLHLKINGIKNIAKDIQIDFYNKQITKFDPELHRIKAIYGENGAGKTAIVTAINIAKKIILNFDYIRQVETQSLLVEMINKKTNKFYIELEFALHGKDKSIDVYRYELSIVKNKNDIFVIGSEKLDVIRKYTRNKAYKNIFEIKDGQILSLAEDEKVYNSIKEATLNRLEDKAFVAAIVEKELKPKEIALDIVALIVFFFSVNVYLEEEDMHEMYLINRMLGSLQRGGKDDQFEIAGSIIDKQLYYMDSKGRDIVDKRDYKAYKKKVGQLENFLKIFKRDLKRIVIDNRNDGERYKCELIFDYGKYTVNREFESTGIKKLIRIFDALSNVDKGGISFIDEMDSNLNDVYLCKLIEYFKNYGKGQLCFTTHNLDPMTVLKDNKNAIDFLSNDNKIVSWKVKGNAAPDRYYRNGMIENSPFNVDAIDFIGMFGG